MSPLGTLSLLLAISDVCERSCQGLSPGGNSLSLCPPNDVSGKNELLSELPDSAARDVSRELLGTLPRRPPSEEMTGSITSVICCEFCTSLWGASSLFLDRLFSWFKASAVGKGDLEIGRFPEKAKKNNKD